MANVKDMDELLFSIGSMTECPLCTEHMINPKFLPCYHTFCCECTEKLCQSQSSRSVPCPLCRSLFDIPESGDIGKMPTNVYVEELMRVNAALLEAKTKLAAQESAKMEAEKFQKAMTDATASLSTAKESCQNLCRQLQQTQQDSSELADTLEKLRKSEKEVKSLNDELAVDKQKKDQLKNLTKGCNPSPDGRHYLGHTSVTTTGRTCQAWASQSPHRHIFYDKLHMFPDHSVAAAVNYCRNPNNDPNGLWCITTDPDVLWESCDVPACSGWKEFILLSLSTMIMAGLLGKVFFSAFRVASIANII